MTQYDESYVDEMMAAYLECAAWSETGDIGQPESGLDFCDDAKEMARRECAGFYAMCLVILGIVERGKGYGAEQCGHDFWLTRNGHGAGFFDRDLGHWGDVLTEKAQSWGYRSVWESDGQYAIDIG